MLKSYQGWGYGFILAACAMSGAIALSTNRALAQVTPDGTLGTQVNNFVITGGTPVNTNLFHSFSSFSVPTGQTAQFQNATSIVNIFGRVTGGAVSNIDGTIQAQGTANLFLMNPSGIIFGPNSRLDIGGSFVGTTANAIRFPGGGEFSLTSTVEPGNTLLSVNPSALFVNQTPAGAIVNQSRAKDPTDPSITDGLKVPDGRSLLFVGGDVRLDGGIIKAKGGRVELGGLAAPGEVNIDILSNGNLKLEFPDGVAKADISLTNKAQITASITSGGGEEAGVVILRGNNVSVDNSQIYSQILEGGQGDPGGILIEAGSLSVANNAVIASNSAGSGTAGDILIEVTGPVSLVNNSLIQSNVEEKATNSNGGLVNITAGSLSVANQSGITTSSFSSGNAGDILIEVTGPVSLVNNSGIQSNVENGATNSNGGFVSIKAGVLSLIGGSQVQTLVRGNQDGTPGQGDAGDVVVEVRDTLTISGQNSQGLPSAIFSTLGRGATGSGGFVSISAGSVQITNGALVTARTEGNGDGGIVTIDAKGDVSVTGNGTLISSNVEKGATGDALGVKIEARSLFMSGGSNIQALTRGNGSAGVVLVKVTDLVDLKGTSPNGPSTGIFTSSEGDATGDGGLITVNAGTLQLSNGAVLSARTQTAGAATGILVNVDTLKLLDGGQILATAYSSGAAGAIVINAKDKIVIRGNDPTFIDRALQLYEELLAKYNDDEDKALKDFLQRFDNVPPGSSGIFANVIFDSTAPAGDIVITTKDLFIWDRGTISVDNPGPRESGNIVIIGRDLIMKNQGTINARATSGNGGNILLSPNTFLLLLENSRISTSSGLTGQPGSGGNVIVDTRYIIGAPFNDNNIFANAYGRGKGGNISFNAERLYDIDKRESDIFSSNDITASSDSGVDGTVTSNVLNADPTQGIGSLPVDPVDPSTLISEACAPPGGTAERPNNQFIVTGRGGLPPDPNAAFPGEAGVNDLGTPNPGSENTTGTPNSTNPTSPTPVATASPPKPEIVEAQGWVYGENGDIIFTANAPNITPTNPVLTPASTCNVSSKLPQ